MPATKTTPDTLSETIDAIDITSATIDLKNSEVHIAFDRGTIGQGNKFVPIQTNIVITATGQDFSAMMLRILTKLQAQGATPDMYRAIEEALYEEMSAQTGEDVTVV